MTKRLLKVLAINPGSRYIGIAIFKGPELEDWRIKVIKGRCPADKWESVKVVISYFLDQYHPDVLSIKKFHRCRSSAELNQLVSRIKQFLKRKGLVICQYSIRDLEAFFSPEERINKKKLAEMLSARYPVLLHEFDKERLNKNPYYIRAFEAVALGAVCSYQLDNL